MAAHAGRKRVAENMAALAAMAAEPCSSCEAGPSWRAVRVAKDVWYECVECGHRAFRVPFRTRGYARAYMEQINRSEAAVLPSGGDGQ